MTPDPTGTPPTDAYFYLDAQGRQQGPVSREALLSLLRSGAVTADRYVWRAGLVEWLPARDLPELRSALPTLDEDSGAPPVISAPPVNPVNARHSPGVREPWGGAAMPPATVQPSSLWKLFTGWLVSIGLATLVLLAGIGVIVFAAIEMDHTGAEQPTPLMWVGFALALLGSLLTLPAIALHHILVYYYWRLIQDGHAETTPGKATGFLFIPLFNYYWMFVAYWGLAKDLNAYADRHQLTIRRPSPGLALAGIIALISVAVVSACLGVFGMPLFLIGWVAWFVMILQLHLASVDVARLNATPAAYAHPA